MTTGHDASHADCTDGFAGFAIDLVDAHDSIDAGHRWFPREPHCE
jgi:hypothetical protein